MMDEKAYNKAVAINMRRIMYEKGISQVDLAKALGYSKQSVSQWMNRAHLPRMEKIDEICKFLGCKRSDLLEHVPKYSCQIPCQIVRNVTYMIHTFARAQQKRAPRDRNPKGL